MTEEHVFDAKGEFHLHDEAVDLTPYRFEDWLAFGIFWILALVIFYQFFTRYALNDSASWTEEIARYLLIATAFIGAAIGVRKNNHIQVDFLYRFLPRAVSRVLSTVVDVIRILFLGYCVGLTYLLTQKIGGSRMAIIDWPIGILYAFVGAGFAIMTWRALDVALENWNRGTSVLQQPELSDSPPAGRPPLGLRPGTIRAVGIALVVAALLLPLWLVARLTSTLPAWMSSSYAIGLGCVAILTVVHWLFRRPRVVALLEKR